MLLFAFFFIILSPVFIVGVILQTSIGAALYSNKGQKQLLFAFLYLFSFPIVVLILSNFEIKTITAAFEFYYIINMLSVLLLLWAMVPNRFSAIIIFVFGIVKPTYEMILYVLGAIRGIQKAKPTFDEIIEKFQLVHLNHSWIQNDIYISLTILLISVIYLFNQYKKHNRIICSPRKTSTPLSFFICIGSFMSFSYFI